MSETKIWNLKFIHAYVGKGRATVAYGYVGDEYGARQDEYRKEGHFGYFDCAIAWCSPKDQFSRKRGRMIAEGRLIKGLSFRIEPKATYSHERAAYFFKAQAVLDSIPDQVRDDAPRWAKDSAGKAYALLTAKNFPLSYMGMSILANQSRVYARELKRLEAARTR